MGNEVYANGRELACKAGQGKSICAFPDVCFTPPENPATPPGVPIPYPNTGMASDTTNGTKKVKITNKEVMLKDKSYFKKSMGDEAGSAAKKGVITSKNMGKVFFIMWSMDVKFEGKNVDRHLDMTTHNHASPPGNTPPWSFLDAIGNLLSSLFGSGPPNPFEIPDSCADAPDEIKLPENVNDAMKDSYENSFPDGTSQERGGTIVQDSDGNIKVVNEHSGSGGALHQDRNVDDGQTVIGTYHTHPYDESEGGHKGVGFSRADIANSVRQESPTLVDGGDKQFLLIPSDNTDATKAQIKVDYGLEFDKRRKAGESLQDAANGATLHVAKKYDMAYYEGSDGVLKKVSC